MGWATLDLFVFIWVGHHTIRVYQETAKFNFLLRKNAFLTLRIQFLTAQARKHCFQKLHMFLQGSRIYDNVVYVNYHKVATIREEVVHGTLKYCWRVGQPKRHNAELKAPILGLECCPWP